MDAGDVNNDGVIDLVGAAPGSNDIVVLLGKGDGSFLPNPATFPTGAKPVSVLVADLDVDGKLDVVVANEKDGTLSLLAGSGNGTFNNQRTLALAPNVRPAAVIATDLDHDGKRDLVVATSGVPNEGIIVLLAKDSFAKPTVLEIYPGVVAVAAADLNRDGNPDVVGAIGSTSSSVVLLGKGDGTFQPGVYFESGIGGNNLALGDLNGDGRTDVVVGASTYHSVTVLVNGL